MRSTILLNDVDVRVIDTAQGWDTIEYILDNGHNLVALFNPWLPHPNSSEVDEMNNKGAPAEVTTAPDTSRIERDPFAVSIELRFHDGSHARTTGSYWPRDEASDGTTLRFNGETLKVLMCEPTYRDDVVFGTEWFALRLVLDNGKTLSIQGDVNVFPALPIRESIPEGIYDVAPNETDEIQRCCGEDADRDTRLVVYRTHNGHAIELYHTVKVQPHSKTDLLAIAELRTAQSDHEPRGTTPSPSAPENVFRRNGPKLWEVRFRGRSLEPVPHLKGMTYLHALLSVPGKSHAALDLDRLENPPPAEAIPKKGGDSLDPSEDVFFSTGTSRQPLFDANSPEEYAKHKRELLAAKEELEAQLEDPTLSPDETRSKEHELEKLRRYLAPMFVARSFGGAAFENGLQKRARQNVCTAIVRAVDALADHSPDLFKHLQPAIRKGASCSYVGGMTWETA